jgi:hypothetical protein
VSVTAPTAPLALLPFDELEERALGVLDLAVRERFALETARLRGRGLAADDALGDLDLADEDERLAAPVVLAEPALRLLAWVGRPPDARVFEATMRPSYWLGVQALYPGLVVAHAGCRLVSGAGRTRRPGRAAASIAMASPTRACVMGGP